ncbi:phosphoethanolamine--lipid A transferase [Acinetobacter lwoffii]|uniref:Phosphoethanolamine--lipid A transferase n=1 Tax=Acinetobacter lwoffii TaxID=28090 RepID=A0AAW8AYV0_ACILW|nr:phosphoethanolamine--lipid A transferase [Acinetobacter lwoffii]MCO8097579.1 phosphoethanolamine--lipid A transferase [Acinetobacter lwoffii]MCU4614082.1 phosphoethanolamine--lipid A transferase [Acinetobacter lwoffii]MDP1369788.1 phosphoethanolamine--lipid A transferase [Acinetobacter lwoffii]MDP1389198.1 phosphoethanolamine--lipid A transferase [Acinetobacter lwoffii]MDP1448184.1 phosphoethanolamine--lipid A transferase [Acinetobacter lwoffii]
MLKLFSHSSSFSQRPKKSISLSGFNMLLAIWLGLILNFAFYQKIHEFTPYTNLKAGVLLVATALIIIAFYNLVLQWLNWKWNAKILASALIILGGFSAYFVNSLGVVITPDQIQNMLQTDAREVRDLWSMRLVIWTLVFVVFPLFIIWMLKIQPASLGHQLVHKSLSSVVSLGLILGLLFCFYVDYAAIFREHRDLKGMLSPQNSIASTLSYYKKKAPKANLPLVAFGEDAHLLQQAQMQDHPKLMVLVVGETARAESFALNGYARNTNPELSKLAVINFNQVSSCGTATAVSVPCMFSGMSRETYDEQLASHREGLLDIAQRAGYQVTWIDNNSGCKGACDRVQKYQIPAQLKQKWCDASGECFDEILVDSLKDYLAHLDKNNQKPQLIVLHQMGSHGPAYFKRSKTPYQPFQPTCNSNAIQGCSAEELKNSYDNSIVYTDHVLAQIIETLKQQTQYQTGFWYLSDHGESTGEHGLYVHGAPYSMAPTQQTHVPMLMWFSDIWQQYNARQLSCLKTQTGQARSQDHLFPSLLSLLDIKTQVTEATNDMLAQCSPSLKNRA